MRLSEVSWTDAAASEADLAVLPVGSTEQHGPHAPLGTDALTATTVAERGVAAADRPVVVGPTIPVGVAEEHRQFTGTCWVSPDTFRAYVRETVESLASHGWDRVVVVNGHGGNVPALEEVCARLTRAEAAYAVPFTWFDAIDLAAVDPALEMGHGGAVETSLLRAEFPDLVAEDRLADAADGGAAAWGEWVSGTNLAPDTADFSENGTVGDPSASDPALGAALLEAAADALAALLAAVAERDPTPADHR
jgi:creatinine amidohydrolase